MKLKKILTGTNYLFVVLLIAGILGIINIFSYKNFFRIDLTENKRYTISDSTKAVLQDLDDIVNIKVYLSKRLPPYMSPVIEEIKDILEEYKVYGGGNIALEYIDPDNDQTLQQKLRFMGIPQLRLNIIEKDQASIMNVYMGLAVLYGDNNEVIQSLGDVENFEYDLTSKIARVTRSEIKTVGFLGDSQILQSDFNRANTSLQEQYFTRDVSVSEGQKVPDDIAVLVIADPGELSDRELFEIDQYIMSGGKAIFLVDKIEIQDRTMQGVVTDSNVTKLIEHYGVKIVEALVLDRVNAQASFRSGGYNIFLPYPFWVRALRQNIADEHPIINHLDSIVMPWVSPIEILIGDDDEKSFSVIAKSSEYSWLQKGNFDLSPKRDYMPSRDDLKQHDLAVAIKGRFTSYFKGKDIPSPAKKLEEQEITQEWPILEADTMDEDRQIIDKSPETKIIVAGNSTFIAGDFPVQFEGNMTFFLNSIDWMTIGDRLIGIRSRTVGDRSLDILTEEKKTAIRYINTFGVAFLLVLFGLFQYYWRKRRKKQGFKEMKQ